MKPDGGTLTADGINCGTRGSDCSASFRRGEVIEFRAEPEEGFRFVRYTEDCGVTGRLTMTTAQTCGATFVRDVTDSRPPAAEELLMIAKPAGGTVVGEGLKCGSQGDQCSVKLPQGSRVKLAGWADKGFTFLGFTGDCNQSGEAELGGPRTCGAMFRSSGATASKGSTTPKETRHQSLNTRGQTGDRDERPSIDPDTAPPGNRSASYSIAPPEPPPPLSPAELEKLAKEDIQEVLEDYRLAYERRDFERMRRVYPNAPPQWRSTFNQFKSIQYTYTGAPRYVDLDAIGGSAVVEVGFSQMSQPKAGGGQKGGGTLRISLQKRGSEGDWIVTASTTIAK
jgi:hypothetical protein